MRLHVVEELIEKGIISNETYCKYNKLCAEINGLIIKENPTYFEAEQILELCRAGLGTEAVLCAPRDIK